MCPAANAGMKRHLALAAATPSESPAPRLEVRHARRDDLARIGTLEWEHKWTQDIYSYRKAARELEHAAFNLVTVDAEGTVQGYGIFDTHPDEALVRGARWRGWVRRAAPCLDMCSLSAACCLFFTQLVCPRELAAAVVGAMLTWLFSELPDLERVLHATRCDVGLLGFLEELGWQLLSVYGAAEPVLEACRRRIVPRLSARQARLEDHDDLRGMLTVDEDRLKERYGEFFLAEVIADERESSYSAVVEVDKLAVGIMSVTTEVDLDTLNENFELAPFHGLRKPCPDDATGVTSRLSQQVMGIRPSSLQEVAEKQAAELARKAQTREAEEAQDASKTASGLDAPETESRPDASKAESEPSASEAERTDASKTESKPDTSKTKSELDAAKTESKSDASKPACAVHASKDGGTSDSTKGGESMDSPQTGSSANVPKGGSEANASKPSNKTGTSKTNDSTAADNGKVYEVDSKNKATVASKDNVSKADSKANGKAVPSKTENNQDEAKEHGTDADVPASPDSPDLDAVAAASASAGNAQAVDSAEAAADGQAPEPEPPQPRVVPLLEQLWGPRVLEPGFGEPEVEEEPIPDDARPDGSRPVLETIWGFPVSADGRVTRKVSAALPGLSTEPASGPRPQPRAVPRYRGAPNAAAVSLFCVRDEHACRAMDLLPAVLARMPDVDYLVLTTPADEPESPLTTLFTRVPHRACSAFPGQLYVFHRASLVTDFEVVSARSSDLGDFRTLIKHTERAERVMLTVRELFLNDAAQNTVFAVRCHDQVVGLVVVRPEMDLEYIRSHFEVEEYATQEHHDPREGYGHLYHFALNPIFQRFSHVILAEVMRLSGLSVILYPVFPAGAEDPEGHSLAAALDRLWPVAWRRQVQYPLQQGTLGPNIPKPHILQRQEPLSLQLTTRGTVFRRRVRINSRIVVVGGGDAGLAVLEKLVFSRELLFTGLTLVDPHGFQGDAESSSLAANMRTSTENFQAGRLGTMCLHAWVNLVRGVMQSIDRRRKCIVVSDAGEVPYDYLVLTCGQQYQLPARLVPRPPRPFTDRRPLFPPAQLPEAPENVFRVNSLYDARRALQYVTAYCLDRAENVIVYGRYLEALTCLETLIQLPVPLHRLVLVLPPGNHGGDLQLTGDPAVDNGILHNLESVEGGIRILRGYTLTYWDVKSNNRIYRIQLTEEAAGAQERYLSCCGLFVYDHKAVELVTFKALNDASLVFDGRLVIDHQFSTNDASIRAVGTMTKYSRRYYADSFDHFEYNSRDVGHALGAQLLRVHGEEHQQLSTKLGTRDRRRSSISGQPLPPEFSRPLVTRARLPGGWQLLSVRAPDPVLDAEPPWVLATGDPVYPSVTGYIRIEISSWRMVQKITCYSQKPIETDNMISLYGLHEVLLNNMVARYQEGLIPDLYEYFRQPWVMMVFHDRFSVFLDNIRQAILRCRCRDEKLTLEEKIVDNLCRYGELTEEEHIKILEDFRTGGVDQLVETWMLQYLANNKYHLPMYARQGTADSLKISKDNLVASANAGMSGSRGHLAKSSG